MVNQEIRRIKSRNELTVSVSGRYKYCIVTILLTILLLLYLGERGLESLDGWVVSMPMGAN